MITESISIPKKSDGYLFAESVFFEQFNKVEFFFEDQKKEELYFIIVKKLFPEIEFDRIFTLNGKRSVIEKAKKSVGRKNRIFVVDKDFDDLLGILKIDLKNLFYLQKYSIENYFFEEEAFLSVLISYLPSVGRKDLNFKYNKLINEIIKKLKLVACYFFIAHKNKLPNIKSASLPLEMFFCDLNCTEPDKVKIRKYKKSIINELKKQNKTGYTKELQESKLKLNYDSVSVFNNIPGKHCIQLAMKILKKKYSKIGNLQFDRISYNLATYSSFTELYPLRDSIYAYLN